MNIEEIVLLSMAVLLVVVTVLILSVSFAYRREVYRECRAGGRDIMYCMGYSLSMQPRDVR